MSEQDELIIKSAVPIDDIDRLMMGRDALMIVWIDTSDRPEIADLGKEDGYAICTWNYLNPDKHSATFYLRVEMRRPGRVNFTLGFKVARYVEQLGTLATYGKLWIVPGPPPAHLTGVQAMSAQELIEKVVKYSGPGLLIELEPHLAQELNARLQDWQRIK